MKDLPVCRLQVLIIFLPVLEISSFKYLGQVAAGNTSRMESLIIRGTFPPRVGVSSGQWDMIQAGGKKYKQSGSAIQGALNGKSLKTWHPTRDFF
jgi:hypothetical protein